MPINTEDLGLPIEYKALPHFFDAHNISKETDDKNALVDRLLQRHNVHSVYDMTCGTGSQVLYLVERGYSIVGSDLCPDLIDQARNKARALNLDVSFQVADIRSSEQGRFDAVISIFSAIGHLSRSDFEVALQNIRNNLKENGIYVFDIFNLQALTDEVIRTFVMDIKSERNGVAFRNQQYSEVDREHGLLISHDCYTIVDDGNAEVHKNTFALQTYTINDMKAILKNNGFEILNLCDMNGSTFEADTSLSMFIVAKKN